MLFANAENQSKLFPRTTNPLRSDLKKNLIQYNTCSAWQINTFTHSVQATPITIHCDRPDEEVVASCRLTN